MERIGLIGASLHGTDVAGLERLRRPAAGCEDAFVRDLADALGASEMVFLATCNRVEVIYAREEGDLPGEADLQLAARFLALDGAPDAGTALVLRTGAAAARHLFRVAASLDSLLVGEDQILAQVRAAYGRGSDAGLVGPLLGPLFHHALAVGKQARSETDLARHPVSLCNLAVNALLQDAAGRPVPPRVAVVGAGEMGRLLVRALVASGLSPAVLANRSLPAARALAADCGARALSLEELRAAVVPVDVLVSATSAPGVVLERDALLRLAAAAPSGRPLLAVDLAVPRDVAAVDDPRVRVTDLDALRALADHNRQLRAQAAAEAERLVDRKVAAWAARFSERAADDAVTELQAAADELLGRELAGLLSGRLAHLPAEDRRAVERWAKSTFGRVMHLPVAALKRLARDMREPGEPGPDGAEGAESADAQGAARGAAP
ncbi:MAG TPA: glutamyl-tRNA reductase [Planctomycetota bacterium]|nr:glutamyl-tRNA reductase [Planctomycetota bacterium]